MTDAATLVAGDVAGGALGSAAAALTVVTTTPVVARATASSPRWTRSNYRGRSVQIAGGPAVALGATIGAVVAGEPGAAVAGAAAAALGLYDDLYGDSHARGLRGHVAALRAGRMTTGAVKLGGLVAAGVVASLVGRGRADRSGAVEGAALGCVGSVLADTALVAGTANLVNLLDLRPGRALKSVTALSAALAARGEVRAVAASTAVAAAAALPSDLGERQMIGDCGANCLGAIVGWCLSRGLSRSGRAVALSVVVALTLASERVSFTRVIEQTPVLAAIDALGRRR